MRASLLTRMVYALALLAFIPGALIGGSGWMALATGGGVMAFGATVLFLIGALLIFRSYQVLRYPGALDARQPNVPGWILRVLGWWSMAGAAVAGLSLFAVGPITRAITGGHVGDGGIAYFVVGLVLYAGASAGWLGCLLFELSRVCGNETEARPPWSKPRQDLAVFTVLAVAAIVTPQLLSATAEPPCGESGVAACVATLQSNVRRVVALPSGEPVSLETTLQEIEFRGEQGSRKWSLTESPVASLKMAGHPLALAPARTQVVLDAAQTGNAVVITMVVRDAGEETARFITTFAKQATLEQAARGRRVAVALPRNSINPGARPAERGEATTHYQPDQLYVQLRRAIGTEQEAAEWPRRTVREVRLVTKSDGGGTSAFRESNIEASCNGVIATVPSPEVPSFEGSWLTPLHAASFTQSPTPGKKTFFDHRDRIACRNGKVWIVSYAVRRPQVQVRRFSAAGELERFVETAIPRLRLGQFEYDEIDTDTVTEDNGRLVFDRRIMKVGSGNPREKLRETFELAP